MYLMTLVYDQLSNGESLWSEKALYIGKIIHKTLHTFSAFNEHNNDTLAIHNTFVKVNNEICTYSIIHEKERKQ